LGGPWRFLQPWGAPKSAGSHDLRCWRNAGAQADAVEIAGFRIPTPFRLPPRHEAPLGFWCSPPMAAMNYRGKPQATAERGMTPRPLRRPLTSGIEKGVSRNVTTCLRTEVWTRRSQVRLDDAAVTSSAKPNQAPWLILPRTPLPDVQRNRQEGLVPHMRLVRRNRKRYGLILERQT
jgi:hypothetical protein